MKTIIHSSMYMKSFKNVLLILLLLAASNALVLGQTIITSTTTGGSWSNGSSWVGGIAPTSSNHVVIVNGATITLISNAQCVNLTLQGIGTRLAIETYTLTVTGYLNGPSLAFTNSIITTNGGGKLKFTGSANRVLFDRWTASYAGKWNCEIALDAGKIGSINTTTITAAINLSDITITSGILQIGTASLTRHLYIDANGASNGYGNVSIASGANLIVTGTMGTRSSTLTTSYCGTITINGTLTIMGPRLNGTINVNSGGVLLMKRISSIALLTNPTYNFTYNAGARLQYDLQGSTSLVYTGAEISQAQQISSRSNIYRFTVNNLSVILNNNVLINDTLKLVGNLLSGGTFSIAYGTNGIVYYKGTGYQQTGSLTIPSSNGPNKLIIDNTSGVGLGANHTINGTVLIKSGSLLDAQDYSIDGTGNFTVEANTIIKTSHPSGMDGTNATTGGSSTYDPTVNFVFNASGEQISGSLPSTFNNLTADLGTILTLTEINVTCNNITVDNGSSLLLAADNALTCNGTLQVNSGSTLDANNMAIGGTGSIIITSGSTFATAHVNGINGSDAVSGSSTFSSLANYTFNGIGPQVTGNKLPTNIHNLTVSNSSSLSLSQSLECFDIATIGAAQLIVPPEMGLTSYGAANFESPLLLQTSTVDYRSRMGTFIHDGYNDNSGSVSGPISTQFRYTGNGTIDKTGRSYYISPSVSDATSGPFNPAGGNPFSHYNLSTRMWQKISNNTTALTTMHAYGFRAATSQTITVTGTPNAEDSYTISGLACPTSDANKWYYMIGNPYPAAVNWQVIWATESTNLDPTMYYRTSSSGGVMQTSTYNAVSGGVDVDGYIAPMQAFWVKASTVTGSETASVKISKNDRTHDWGSTAPYLKSSAFQKSKTEIEKESFKLFINTHDISDGLLFVQSELAKDEYDKWDSNKMFTPDAAFAELYTFSPEAYKLVIQSVTPTTNEKQFPIGLLNTIKSRQYSFKADLSKSNGKYNYLLEDKKLNITQDLFLNNTYTFISDTLIDDIGARFVLHIFQSPSVKVKNSLTVCSPQSVNLTEASITAGSTEGLTFSYWIDSKATIEYLSPQNAETGTYYIKGTASNGSYKISEPIVITINNPPTIITTNPTPVIEPATIDLTAPEITLGSTSGLTYSYWLDALATIQYINPQVATTGNYYIKGINEFTGCFAIGGPVIVSVTTDVPSDINNGITIYSSGNQIYINNCQPNSVISVYDMLGNMSYSGIAGSTSKTISSNLRAGIYIVKIVSGNNYNTQKVFIR